MPKTKALTTDSYRTVATRSAHGVTRASGGRLLTASYGPEQVTLFDVASGAKLGGFGSGEAHVCWYAEQSSRGLVAAGFGDLTLRVWDPETDAVTTLGKLGGIVPSISWSADGRHLFVGNSGDSTVRLYDMDGACFVGEGKTKRSGTWFVALAPDARRAVSGAGDKLVHVWDPHTGVEVAALAGHTGRINWLTMYPDGRRVASASQDRTARVWDLHEQRQLLELGGHTKEVGRVALSPDGKQLASISTDGTVRFWNADDGAFEGIVSVGRLAGNGTGDFTADGRTFIVAGSDGELRAFDVPLRPRPGLTRESLFANVWASPNEDAPREVLADWLIEHGDPRGEYIGLQLARARGSATPETRRRERALLKQHQREWLGPIAPFVRPTSVTFERGFVVGCTLRFVKEADDSATFHPAWSTVKRFATEEGSPARLVAHLLEQGAIEE